MRRIIALRLVESKQQIPHFYLVAECALDNLLQLRKQINDSLESKITINDFIVKASGLAIKKVPQMRCSWQDGNIVQFGSIDISVAVAIEDGLITPIVKDVDKIAISDACWNRNKMKTIITTKNIATIKILSSDYLKVVRSTAILSEKLRCG